MSPPRVTAGSPITACNGGAVYNPAVVVVLILCLHTTTILGTSCAITFELCASAQRLKWDFAGVACLRELFSGDLLFIKKQPLRSTANERKRKHLSAITRWHFLSRSWSQCFKSLLYYAIVWIRKWRIKMLNANEIGNGNHKMERTFF